MSILCQRLVVIDPGLYANFPTFSLGYRLGLWGSQSCFREPKRHQIGLQDKGMSLPSFRDPKNNVIISVVGILCLFHFCFTSFLFLSFAKNGSLVFQLRIIVMGKLWKTFIMVSSTFNQFNLSSPVASRGYPNLTTWCFCVAAWLQLFHRDNFIPVFLQNLGLLIRWWLNLWSELC